MRTRWELALALVLAAALVALGAAFGAGRKDEADARLSTFNDARGGLHALHALLAACGENPRRVTSAPSAGDPTARTLVVAQPSVPVTKRDVAALAGWVEAGGRLVVVGGGPPVGSFESPVKPLLDAFGLREVAITRLAGDEMRIEDEGLRQDVGRIEWPAAFAVEEDRRSDVRATLEPLVTTEGRCLAGRVARGDPGGEVLVVSDPRLLENGSLSKEDNAVLAVRLLAGRGTVAFDEFHHGHGDGDGTDHLAGVLAAMLTGTWPGRAVILLALAGAVYLAGAVFRFGAPDEDAPPPRRALSEHAEALGRIFETAGARGEALRILAAGAVRSVAPRAGIPASLAPAQFALRLAASGSPGAADLARAIERAAAARAVRDSDLAAAAADLAAAKRRYLHGGR